MSDVRDPQRDQPLPVPGRLPVQRILMAAIAERRAHGIRKYGRPLETHNGRDALTDAWEEALDLVTYLTQARLERGDHITTVAPEGDGHLQAAVAEALRLVEAGPRGVHCPQCKAAAGLTCRGPLYTHHARDGVHRDEVLRLLRTALGATNVSATATATADAHAAAAVPAGGAFGVGLPVGTEAPA